MGVREEETMEELLREEALPRLQRRHLPAVLHPQEVLELEMLEDKADTGRVAMEEMDKAMEEEVATEEETKEVVTGVV